MMCRTPTLKFATRASSAAFGRLAAADATMSLGLSRRGAASVAAVVPSAAVAPSVPLAAASAATATISLGLRTRGVSRSDAGSNPPGPVSRQHTPYYTLFSRSSPFLR